MSEQERAYALLYERKTIREIAETLGVSREQVMTWICQESEEQRRGALFSISEPSRQEHEAGRQRGRLYPEG